MRREASVFEGERAVREVYSYSPLQSVWAGCYWDGCYCYSDVVVGELLDYAVVVGAVVDSVSNCLL